MSSHECHQLVEIRVRALKNILCKIDHGLITLVDLAQEKRLFVLLLEWFNFPNVPLQGDVLNLCNQLAKHSSGGQHFREIGALEFLSQLRPNVEPKIQVCIDEIVDNLFKLPDTPVDTQAIAYQLHPQMTMEQQALPAVACDVEDKVAGYFQQNNNRAKLNEFPLLRMNVNNAVKCLKFSTFPWLTLTVTDRHILSSNETSLRSSNQTLVRSTCELLQDVIMQDFPAEIFLQRPKIVQNLLLLTKLAFGRDGTQHLALQAVGCLYQLCNYLRNRLNFHRDPSFFSAKNDLVSQNSSVTHAQETQGTRISQNPSPRSTSPRPSVIGRTVQRPRGDGQDGDAASSSGSSSQGHIHSRSPTSSHSVLDLAHVEMPKMENEDSVELQFQQLSLPQFCCLVLEHVISMLRTGSRKIVLCVLELLAEVVLLINYSISEDVWVDDSLTGRELRESLIAGLDALGESLAYHSSSINVDLPEAMLLHHRMTFISIALFTMQLLQVLVPVEKANEVLPESIEVVLYLLSLDISFRLAYPNVHETITAYLEQVSSESYTIYKRATEIVHSMEFACRFLKEIEDKDENNLLELIELADQAVTSLPYHQHLQLIQKYIEICSEIWKSAQASPLLQGESQKVLLKLLSHPLPAVKSEAYLCSLNIVKECLGIYNVTKPMPSVCQGVHFLLHGRVLYEICTFGLQDSLEQVNSAAKNILVYLLQGGLIMNTLTWSKLIEAFYPVIPILQGFADAEGPLGSCILALSETYNDAGDGVLPRKARLRAALRLLMCKKQSIRSIALKHLMWHLINEEGATDKQPSLQGSVLQYASNVYVLDESIDLHPEETSTSLFKGDNVFKVYEILISETVDLALRKSAAEQLVIMMQDNTMHGVLKNHGIIEKIISFVHESVHRNGKSMQCLVLPCLAILRKLVYSDPTLRHSLAQETPFLLALFRVSLILQKEKSVLIEAAVLLSLLLFDEVATINFWCDHSSGNATAPPPFSLPVTVARRYNLTIKVAVHHAVSPYCTVVPSASDHLTTKPASDMLKIAWNLAWYNGIDHLLDQMKCLRTYTSAEFVEKLKLSPIDGVMLKVTNVASGLQDCLSSITLAVSHITVSSALSRMRLYLLNDKLALKQGINSSLTVLQKLEWHTALGRFLQILPACTEDEKLLADVVSFLRKLLLAQKEGVDSKDLTSLLELLLRQESNPLLNFFVAAESPVQGEMDEIQTLLRQKLRKELTEFFNIVLQALTSVTDRKCLLLAGPFRTLLAVKFLQCLRITDAPHFYGLPSLERTLRGMVHITALPRWSLHSAALEPYSLCMKYLTGLLEVISAFYVEWGGNAMSYMGKGVTKSAVLCLLQLSHEMMTQANDETWVSLWSLAYEQNNEEQMPSRLGLAWLIPLWVDRDPEVRFASLGIGSALTLVENGCTALASSCQNISGGLWGTVLNILLDQSECSMVRREAASILQNLLMICLPANTEETKDVWQTPCVHDEESGVSLVGLPAFQALLYHCQFYEHVAYMAKHCYFGRQMFDFSVAKSTENSLLSNSFEDSLKYWRMPSVLSNHNQSSSPPSTSSTLVLPQSSPSVGGPELYRVLQVSALSAVIASEAPSNRLTAQGKSDTDTLQSLDSENSHVSVNSEQCAVVTPHLLSAVCSLLTNLLAAIPEDTLIAVKQNHLFAAFHRVVNTSLLERCLWELRTPLLHPNHRQDIKAQVLSLLQYLSSLSGLFQTCLILHYENITQDDLLKPLLSNILTVLCVRCKDYFDCEVTSAIYQTWTDLFILLNLILRKSGQATFPSVVGAAAEQWAALIDTISVCIQLSNSTPYLYTASLQFISLLLAEEGKRQFHNSGESQCPTITELLEISDGTEPSGICLCEILLQSYEGKSTEDAHRKVAAGALTSLLAVSGSAQKHALQAGVIDSSIEQMKHTCIQLKLDSLRPGKVVQRKKDDSLIQELKIAMQLLRNCLYNNAECKVAASDAHLVSVVHSLWPWFLMDDQLLLTALQLLCVYTANLSASCNFLCWGGGASLVPQCSQRSLSNNSLVHLIMKQALHKSCDNSMVRQMAFALLSNLAMFHECKGILQKSNFLQNFLAVPLPKTTVKGLSTLTTLWLKLLLNISFGDDGQQMILKMNGSLELLTTMSQYKHKGSQPTALLILHNICFSPANKPKVLANDNIVSTFAACLENDNPLVQTIGASALWALLHNYQKAKVILKNPSIKTRVDEVYLSVKKYVTEADEVPLRTYFLKCLDNLTILLNS
eukprot:gi/632942735/ref/XP_007886571.1/ PREDICTED: rotatin [Callorhinchus milii]